MKCSFRKNEFKNKKEFVILFFFIIEICSLNNRLGSNGKKALLSNENFNFNNNNENKNNLLTFIKNSTSKNNNDSNTELINNFEILNNTQTINSLNTNKISIIEISRFNHKPNLQEKTLHPTLLNVIPQNKLIKIIPLISEFQKKKLKSMEKRIKNKLNSDNNVKINKFKKKSLNNKDFDNTFGNNSYFNISNKNREVNFKNENINISFNFSEVNNKSIIQKKYSDRKIKLNSKKIYKRNDTFLIESGIIKQKLDNLMNKIKPITLSVTEFHKREIDKNIDDSTIKSSDIENEEIVSILEKFKNKKKNFNQISSTSNSEEFLLKIPEKKKIITNNTEISNRFYKKNNFTIGLNRTKISNFNVLKNQSIMNLEKYNSSIGENKSRIICDKIITQKKNQSKFITGDNFTHDNTIGNFIINKVKSNKMKNPLKEIDFDLDIDIFNSQNEKIEKRSVTKKENNFQKNISEDNIIINNKTKELEDEIVNTVNLIEDSNKASKIEKEKVNYNIDYMTIANKKMNSSTESKIDKKIDSLNKLIENYEILSNFTYSIMKSKEILSQNTTNIYSVNDKSPWNEKKKDISGANSEPNTLSNRVSSDQNSDSQDKIDNKPEYKLITLLEEMEKNQDERKRLFVFKLFLILCFIINLSMFFTWKLSRKNERFPANLIFSQIICYSILTILIFIIQNTYRNSSFEKLGFLIYITVNYYSIFTNLLYFLAVIILYKNQDKIEENKKYIIYIEKMFKFYHKFTNKIIMLFALMIYFWINIPLKNCFIGACLIDKSHKYYVLVLPNKIESFLIFLLFSFVICYYIYSKKDFIIKFYYEKIMGVENYIENKNLLTIRIKYPTRDKDINELKCNNNQEEIKTADEKNIFDIDHNEKVFSNISQENIIENHQFTGEDQKNKINNKLKENEYTCNSLQNKDLEKSHYASTAFEKSLFISNFKEEMIIILIYEFVYFLYSFIDSTIKYIKIFKIVDYRFDDYCSIHDYNLLIKTIILFIFLGVNKRNMRQWRQAFSQEKDLDDEIVEIHVNDILAMKSILNHNLNKNRI